MSTFPTPSKIRREIEDLRGYSGNRKHDKKMGPPTSWLGRDWISAVYRRKRQNFTSDIYNYGGITYTRKYYFSYKELINHLAILAVSGGTVGYGIQQLISTGLRG
jgi:hypothetical protein